MEINSNADVFTRNDQKVGTVARVVIDPKTKEVTHLVVDKGFLFTHDKLVPMSLVGQATEDRVQLSMDKDALDNLQDFEETFHVSSTQLDDALGKDRLRRVQTLYWYPPVGSNWWFTGGYSIPPYVTHTLRNNPEGTIPLKKGAKVFTSDEQNIGKVDTLLTEETENRVTHLVIAQGLFSSKKILIPSIWIDTVLEDELVLIVDSDLIERIPAYEAEKA
jgi:uncharacterized protein YrrD